MPSASRCICFAALSPGNNDELDKNVLRTIRAMDYGVSAPVMLLVSNHIQYTTILSPYAPRVLAGGGEQSKSRIGRTHACAILYDQSSRHRFTAENGYQPKPASQSCHRAIRVLAEAASQIRL